MRRSSCVIFSLCHFIRQSAVYSIPLNMSGGQLSGHMMSVTLVGLTSASLGQLLGAGAASIRGRADDRPLHEHPASAAGGGAL